ncbi:LysR family transcriptional regulator [Brucella intermedia]|uniref:LysR family transcriptional regulator n=1 Tax=Brucella intermedia TaxID=94625 RepID=UPI00224AEED2|nr:LysR family transcriptional regulator [Brucella intermedia]
MISTALRYFIQTVDSGSIADAAQRLHVAPSAISRMIRKLESDYGVALIERMPRGIRPSEAGLMLAEYGRRAMLDAERTRSDIIDLRSMGQRTIRIAANQAFGTEMLPDIIGRLQAEIPGFQFHLSIHQSDIINARIREGKEDIGITHDMSRPRHVDILHQSSNQLYAVMAPTHELAAYKSVTYRDVARFPVALMGPGSTNRITVDMGALAEGVTFEPALTSNNVSAIQNYCREWGAVSFSSRVTVSASIARGELVAVPLSIKNAGRRYFHIQVMAGRQLPRSLHRVIQEIRSRLEDN